MLGALAVVAAAAFLRVGREGRRLVWLPNGVLLVARQGEATFFPDSAYAVTLGEHEVGAYPVRIAAWYASPNAALSERTIRLGIEEAVARRREARLERVAGGVMAMSGSAGGVPPYALIALDVWQFGGFRLDVRLLCPVALPGVEPTVMEQAVTSNRGATPTGAMLERLLTYALNQAARARCPGDEGRAGVAARAGRSEVADTRPQGAVPPHALPRDSAAASPRDSAAGSAPGAAEVSARGAAPVPSFVAAPVSARMRLPEDVARGDSIALAGVSARGGEVRRLLMTGDTLQLRVGDVIDPAVALRLTALRADGSAVDRFVPLYSVDDAHVAQFGPRGLRGLAPGLTRVVVRPMLREAARPATPGVSASFVVRVMP